MHRLVIALPIIGMLGIPVLSCQPACDRTGCEAGAQPFEGASIEQGIAGVAFSESDVVANGCNECTLSQGRIRVWASTNPIETDAEAATLVGGAEPDQTVTIHEHYELALAPGHWLVCVGAEEEHRTCAALSITAGDLFTVHAHFVYGPASLVVFDPGADAPRPREELFQVSP
jgi:hypothetical protein